MSFRLFSSDATVCQMYYSLVAALDILVSLISACELGGKIDEIHFEINGLVVLI
jgi:hypothetical protein